jgi:hypothetical protein
MAVNPFATHQLEGQAFNICLRNASSIFQLMEEVLLWPLTIGNLTLRKNPVITAAPAAADGRG